MQRRQPNIRCTHKNEIHHTMWACKKPQQYHEHTRRVLTYWAHCSFSKSLLISSAMASHDFGPDHCNWMTAAARPFPDRNCRGRAETCHGRGIGGINHLQSVPQNVTRVSPCTLMHIDVHWCTLYMIVSDHEWSWMHFYKKPRVCTSGESRKASMRSLATAASRHQHEIYEIDEICQNPHQLTITHIKFDHFTTLTTLTTPSHCSPGWFVVLGVLICL